MFQMHPLAATKTAGGGEDDEARPKKGKMASSMHAPKGERGCNTLPASLDREEIAAMIDHCLLQKSSSTFGLTEKYLAFKLGLSKSAVSPPS